MRCSADTADVGSVMSNYSEAAELVASGKLRALAVASAKRVDGWPNVPTVAEQGFKDYSVEAWYGLVTPAKTPKDKVAELSKWCSEAMLAPELKAKWRVAGPHARSAARRKNSPRICASSRRITRA